MEFPRFVIALAAVAEGMVRIPLAKMGTWFKGAKKFSITKADVDSMVACFRADPRGEVVIDFDHSTEFAAGTGAAAPAAGWLKSVEDGPDADGVLWGQAEFGEKARAMLAAKEYKYISPVIAWGSRNEATGKAQGACLRSIALTNIPVLKEMPAIALSEAGWTEEEARREAMVTRLILADRTGKCRAIAEDGTETMLSVEGFPPEPKVLALSDVKRDATGRFDFSCVEKAGEDVLIASDVVRAMTVQNYLDDAVKAGKVTPAQRPMYERIALADFEACKNVVDSLKPGVDFKEHGIGGSEKATNVQDAEKRVIALSEEKMKSDSKLSFDSAMTLVLSENPDLRAIVRKGE